MRRMIEAVVLRLKEQVPELGTVDINLGQMEPEGTESGALVFPLGLVDVAGADYLPQMKTDGRATATLEVELFFRAPSPAGRQVTAQPDAWALDMFDIVSKADGALQGLAVEGFRPLRRVALTRNKPYSPRSFVLTYACKATGE